MEIPLNPPSTDLKTIQAPDGKDRDDKLDILKGLACLLMAFAHAPSAFQANSGNDFTNFISYIGGFAPAIFFAVSGVTTVLQTKKKPLSQLVIFYILFAFFGYSYNSFWRPEIWKYPVMDILQVISAGVLLVALLERYIQPRRSVYLLIGAGIFILHWQITKHIPPFPFRNLLFEPTDTFALIPWVFPFFLGVFAYHVKKNSTNLVVCMFSAVVLLGLLFLRTPYDPDLFLQESNIYDKWNMSIAYFLVTVIVVFLSFYLVRNRKVFSAKNPLVFLGRNSLLFLFAHLFFLKIFQLVNFAGPAVIMAGLPIFTFLGMLLAVKVNRNINPYFKNRAIWTVLLAAILLVPVFITDHNIITWVELILGLIFAANYHTLMGLFKPNAKKDRPANGSNGFPA